METDRRAVAIVGTRKVSPAGRAFAEALACELAALGFTIVSGLARGVDAAAPRALSGQGRTVAVMGCGLDRTYPADHRQLRESIAQQGAVLSELPLGPRRTVITFPAAIGSSADCHWVSVVMEAAVQSGVTITARLAASRGREVFDGAGLCQTRRIAEVRIGPLKDGARLVESAQDILEELLPQLDVPFREQLSARGAGHNRRSLELGADRGACV